MLEQINPFRSTFALAGWVFADLLLIFAILFFATTPSTRADLAASPIASTGGSLRVGVSAGLVAPYEGACVRIDDTRYCDNGEGDGDATGGAILISGLAPGAHQVAPEAPDAFQPSESRRANIHPNEEVQLDFVLIPLPTATEVPSPTSTFTPTTEATPEATFTPTTEATPDATFTPTLEPTATPIPLAQGMIYTRNPVDNAPIAGACYRLTGPVEVELCDNDDNDADPADGNIAVNDLQFGYYDVAQTTIDAEIAPAENAVLRVTAEGPNQVVFYNRPLTGSLSVFLSAGEVVPDACIVVNGPDGEQTYCDNDGDDADPTAGRILLTRLPEGNYTIASDQDSVPDGYTNAPGQAAIVGGGGKSAVELLFPPMPSPTATGEPATIETSGTGRAQIVTRSGSTGDEIPGACYQLTGQATIDICDGGEGDGDSRPGWIKINSLPVGNYMLTQTTAPEGYRLAGAFTFSVQGQDRLDSYRVYNVPQTIAAACVPSLDPDLIEMENIPVAFPQIRDGDKNAEQAFLDAFRAALEPELEKRGESWDTFKAGAVLTFGRQHSQKVQGDQGSEFATQINDLIFSTWKEHFEGAGRKDYIVISNNPNTNFIDISVFIYRTTCA